MRAIVAAPAEGGYRCVERAAPELRPGELALTLGAAGICRTDLAAARGELGVPHGRVLGHEASGVVVAGDAALEGRRVVIVPMVPCASCVGCRAEPRAAWACATPRWLGLDLDGVFAECGCTPGRTVRAVDRHWQTRRRVGADPRLIQFGKEWIGPHPRAPSNVGEGLVAIPQHRTR